MMRTLMIQRERSWLYKTSATCERSTSLLGQPSMRKWLKTSRNSARNSVRSWASGQTKAHAWLLFGCVAIFGEPLSLARRVAPGPCHTSGLYADRLAPSHSRLHCEHCSYELQPCGWAGASHRCEAALGLQPAPACQLG